MQKFESRSILASGWDTALLFCAVLISICFCSVCLCTNVFCGVATTPRAGCFVQRGVPGRSTAHAFQTVLLQGKKLQIVVRPCLVEGHSILQFQAEDRKSYPKALRVPLNSRREIADRAFYASPMLRHVEIAAGLSTAANRLASPLSPQPRRWSFPRLLRSPRDCGPGCVQYNRRVFAECCSLSKVGTSQEADDNCVFAPGAQLGRYAFELPSTCLCHVSNGSDQQIPSAA